MLARRAAVAIRRGASGAMVRRFHRRASNASKVLSQIATAAVYGRAVTCSHAHLFARAVTQPQRCQPADYRDDFVKVDAHHVAVDKAEEVGEVFSSPAVYLSLPLPSVPLRELPCAEYFTATDLLAANAYRDGSYRFCMRADSRDMAEICKEGGFQPHGGKHGHLSLDAHRYGTGGSRLVSTTTSPGMAYRFGREENALMQYNAEAARYEGHYTAYLACAPGGLGVKYDKGEGFSEEYELSFADGVPYRYVVSYRHCHVTQMAGYQTKTSDYGPVYVSRCHLARFFNETVCAVRNMQLLPEELERATRPLSHS